jgi:hypothetical protein
MAFSDFGRPPSPIVCFWGSCSSSPASTTLSLLPETCAKYKSKQFTTNLKLCAFLYSCSVQYFLRLCRFPVLTFTTADGIIKTNLCRLYHVTNAHVVVHVDGVRACLWTAASKGPFVHLHMMSAKSHGEIILTGKNRPTRRKTCPSATLSTTNPTWNDPARTWAFEVRDRWLTAWAMARPNLIADLYIFNLLLELKHCALTC